MRRIIAVFALTAAALGVAVAPAAANNPENCSWAPAGSVAWHSCMGTFG